jgi:hypothetical protein
VALALEEMRQELAHAEFVVDYEKICHTKRSFDICHWTFVIGDLSFANLVSRLCGFNRSYEDAAKFAGFLNYVGEQLGLN